MTPEPPDDLQSPDEELPPLTTIIPLSEAAWKAFIAALDGPTPEPNDALKRLMRGTPKPGDAG